ncbi:Z-ring formation inhibitor MciZ [Alteribacter keqinensis]|uniref:Z-ring formation inhibitor MciZ n=1 Tax=Alteribacter keqinensis TaxID=2483800 RepID=A0A3M7TVW1_9BACI|nr:Z-ring formation inhibitor MciZ [Alteribacter keqinensis]
MHVYLKENGFVVAGKVWQVKAYLKKLSSQHETVEQWITKGTPNPDRSQGSNIVPFPRR